MHFLKKEIADKVKALAGTDSDYNVAKKLGVSSSTVGRYRRMMGVPTFYPGPANAIPEERWEKIDPMLGSESDLAIAGKVGLSDASIRRRRMHLGIPTFGASSTTNVFEIRRLFIGWKRSKSLDHHIKECKR